MGLTIQQRSMVEENMKVVDWAVFLYVDIYPGVPCLEREDLMQTGYLALCEAAMSYDGRAGFRTYAETVVRNKLMDYCRKNSIARVSLDAAFQGQDGQSIHDLLTDDSGDALAEIENRDVLERCCRKMRGVTRMGMDAMLMRSKGYTGVELAAHYGVPPNYLTAWASKARRQLRRAHVREQFND